MVEKTFDIKDFENLSIQNSFEVTIVQSNEYKVKVDCNENIEKFLEVSMDGETLNLHMENNKAYYNVTCKAVVYLPNLSSVDVKGASKVNIPDFETEALEIEVSGAANIFGNVATNKLNINSKGASKIHFTGQVKHCKILSAGATKIEAKDLLVNELEVEASGASKIVVHAVDELNVNLSGASKFDYYGNPQILNKKISGVGKINHLD